MRKEELIINVIFDANKGSCAKISREAVCGAPLGTLPHPTRAGYAFEGWYCNGEPVDEQTLVTAREDITLVAHWAKKREARNNRKKSMLRLQKTAVAVLSFVLAVLIVAFLFVNHIVAIYGLTDVYVNENGEKQTERYYVKKRDGVYGLYDKKGYPMETNEQGYYLAKSGNQYVIDAETGEYELYAVVDYDAAVGEMLGFNDRIMMFPQISQTNTYSIKVTNQYGTYEFYRDKNGDVQIRGAEGTLASYNPTLFASLCVSCGYTLTMQKLDFYSEESNAPRLEDGTIDYSAYGLVDRYDENGALIYTPTVYTITKAIYTDDGACVADPNTVYTVKVGDPILSGGGYYVQMEGRTSVYIVSSTIANTVLQPVEALVTPMVVYPSTTLTHAMVQDFVLGSLDLSGMLGATKEELKKLDPDLIAAFTYEDLESRQNTIYSSVPYICQIPDFMEGYVIHQDNASKVLASFYDMEFLACKKLGITHDALREFGLDGEVFSLSFNTPVLDDKDYVESYVENLLLISQKTENDTYYVASFLTDMIVEVDQYYLSFLEWELKEWYRENIFFQYIAHITSLDIRIGDKTYNFTLDNSESDQSQQINADKIKVFCEQFTGGKQTPTALDYMITYSYLTDTGTTKTAQISAKDNFGELYEDLLYFAIEGDADETEFKKQMGMSFKDYVAQGDEVCDAIISYHLEDLAATMNNYTYIDKDGNEVKLYTENNKSDVVIRFYQYTDRKAYFTIEVIDQYDENGNPISDPTKASGAFYVRYSYLEMMQEHAEMILNKELINPKGEVVEIAVS